MSTQDLARRDEAATDPTPPLVPLVDVTEDDAGITLVADLPGASRESLSIGVDGDTLTIEAPVALGELQSLQAVYAEVRSGRYRRSFTLSRELDSGHIDATLKDGVLTLRLPKLEQARPRRIEVRAA
ncbi:MAG TPA: Hsp20/alpha crystallin family protein [Albitalea sp.]|uniref:Hsp20/alpha crystallin family protein n=1 Tax=Piscinibacter sp. TaxID=1903157 RepID=UPI002ED4F587